MTKPAAESELRVSELIFVSYIVCHSDNEKLVSEALLWDQHLEGYSSN